MEATAERMGRSLDEEEDERLEDAESLEGVRERVSRRRGVREPRFGGITTGAAFFNPRPSVLLEEKASGLSKFCSFILYGAVGFCGGAEVNIKALGTIIL
jgi:hypothetical protein